MSPREINLTNIYTHESRFEEGYDSDGNAGPWCKMEELEGIQDSEEADLREIENFDDLFEEEEEEIEVGVFINIGDNVLHQMLGKQLKEELKLRLLPIGGTKPVMIERLKTALQMKKLKYPEGYKKKVVQKEEKVKGLSGFPDTAW